jgi:hypothetical protein
VLTAAMIGRLKLHAFIINMNGKSFSVKETKQMLY